MQTNRLIVSETFFSAMGVPLSQGRELSAADSAAAPKVIVVNETFVHRYLADENPVGQTVSFLRSTWTIVGVCRDFKTRFVKETVTPMVYFSFRQFPLFRAAFVVRTSMSPLAFAATARKAVQAINPQVPLTQVAAQTELVDRSLSQERLLASICPALGGVALLLSCIGLYGLMAFTVARRRNEIAIRMAIGAQPRDVSRAIVREALLLVAIGIGAGLPLALFASSLLEKQLYEVSPNDPLTLGGATAVLLVVALSAAWLPATRASRVDPLRAE